MATCPNINLDSWKQLVDKQGLEHSYYLWDKFQGAVPEAFYNGEVEITKTPINYWEEPAFKARNPNFRHEDYVNTVDKFGRGNVEHPELNPYRASTETIKQVKEMLNRVGISIESLDIAKYGGVNGVADLFNNVVQIAEGKEDVALTEEGMHIGVALLKVADKELYTQLMNKIGQYQAWRDTLDTYKDDKAYQIDGKPNIPKLKEEAVGKVLAQYAMKENGDIQDTPEKISFIQQMWDKIVSVLNKIIGRSEINPFKTATNKILNENIGTKEDINSNEVFQQKEDTQRQSELFNDITTNKGRNLVKVEGKNEDNEDTNWYELDGKKILNRVTDLAHDFYKKIFKNKEIEKSSYQEAVDEVKRNFGVKGHAMMESIHKSIIGDDGLPRTSQESDDLFTSSLNTTEKVVYNTLKANLQERINKISEKYPGTKFLSEKIVYTDKIKSSTGGEAGTIDYMFITPQGKVGIWDWKFIDLNTNRYEDVPWYKVNAWKRQIGEYKLILEKEYGVKSSEFLDQNLRAIPILAKYNINAKNPEKSTIEGIRIGNVDAKLENDLYLVPVALKEESTGNEKLDGFISKLNNYYDKVSNITVKNDTQKKEKAELLNSIYKTIRHLQLKQDVVPLLTLSGAANVRANTLITYINNAVNNDKIDYKNHEAVSEVANKILEMQEYLKIFSDIDVSLNEIFNDKGLELDANDKEIISTIRNSAFDIRLKATELNEVQDKFIDAIAKNKQIDNILSIDMLIRGWGRLFNETSAIPMKTMALLYKLRKEARHSTDFAVSEENKKLVDIKEKYTEWAKSKGKTIKDMFDGIIKKKDKNELIDEYNPDYYKKLDKAIAEGDEKWILENVDKDALYKYLDEQLEIETQRIENRHDSEYSLKGDPYEIEDAKSKARERVRKEFDINHPENFALLVKDSVKRFPLREKWESKEFKSLNEKGNEAALNFYNYIKERNAYYTSIGYIGNDVARKFLPYVEKTLAQKLVFGGDMRIGESLLKSISIDSATTGIGSINETTLEVENKLPKYFTREINGETSSDLFYNIALYNQMAIRYKFLQDIEGEALLIKALERSKNVIATSMFGGIVKDKDTGKPEIIKSDANYKLLETHLNALIYDNKMEKEDTVLFTIGDGFEKLNNKLGYKIFPENLKGRAVTLNRALNANNSYFQMRIMGIHPLAAMSNLFGGTFQGAINAGLKYTKNEFLAAESRIAISKLSGEDGRKTIGAIKYFLSLTDNQNREDLKELSLSKMSQENIQDWIMVLMRKSDIFVQSAISLATFDNTVVMDGKLVNAREYLRTNDADYANRYNVNENERQKIEKVFEGKVKKLIADRGIMKLGKVEDDEFVIPEVNRNSESVHAIRDGIQQDTKNALGNLTEDEIRQLNTNIYAKSFMVFKNWIPRLVDLRAAQLKYNNRNEAYEWGRCRTFFRFLQEDWLRALKATAKSIAMMNGFGSDESVGIFSKMYEAKQREYEEMTGEPLKMTKEEFIDMVRQNMKGNIRDLVLITALMSSWFMVAHAYPPGNNEDERVRNAHKFMVRALDKFSDEVFFFYSPVSAQQIVGQSVFPAISNFTDIAKLVTNFTQEMYGITTGNEKVAKNAHPTKYFMKMFPMTNQISALLPLFAPDMAKSLGIAINSQSGTSR